MKGKEVRKDLFVLTADLDIANAVRGLLTRPQSLAIAPPIFNIQRHPQRDGGCRANADAYLRPFRGSYRYALAVFDRHGCGSACPRTKIQEEVEDRLAHNGWPGRAKAIVIDPEIEAWVWSDSPAVPATLGWPRGAQLRGWLEAQGCWPQGCPKPPRPKKAMTMAMEKTRVRRSPRLFSRLAARTSLHRCKDPAFQEFCATLQSWFPAS